MGRSRPTVAQRGSTKTVRCVYRAVKKVESWVEAHNYEAYEPFDGLSSPLRPFTFGIELFERFLQQAVRQSPINIRPLVGVRPLPSTKGRGYMAAGYLKMYRLTGDRDYRDKAVSNSRVARPAQVSEVPGALLGQSLRLHEPWRALLEARIDHRLDFPHRPGVPRRV